MIETIYFNQQDKNYYLKVAKGDNIFCSVCRKVQSIDDSVFIHTSFGKKDFARYFYCSHCASSKNEGKVVDSMIVARIVLHEPPGSTPAILRPPTLVKSSQVDCFSLATQQTKDNEKVVDRTVYAFREPSIEGAKVGCDMDHRIKELDTPVKNSKIALSILTELKNSNKGLEVTK